MKISRAMRAAGVVAALTAALGASTGSAASRTNAPFIIWSDKGKVDAVKALTVSWGAANGLDITVVGKDFLKIDDQLATVAPSEAPDVVFGVNDWTGKLASNGLVLPLKLSAALTKQFPASALNAYSYISGRKSLYGVPQAFENVALVVNTKLAKVPTSWADLEKKALAFKAKKTGNFGIAVPNGDAYHMYPFLTGLCGYIFGTNAAGVYDVNRIGLDDKKFLKNAPLIDKWQKEKLFNSSADYGAAADAFMKNGTAAYWVTGTWNAVDLKDPLKNKTSSSSFAVVPFPKIVCAASPFVGVKGAFLTKYARTHSVESAGRSLMTYLAGQTAQIKYANAILLPPANSAASKKVTNPVIAAFNKAAGPNVMPNVPEIDFMWSAMGDSWNISLKATGATKAKTAFAAAAKKLRVQVG